jgi:hypothetical protein
MLGALRRCRILALTLLLAAPGLGGTWLSVVHPCPVDAPWLAQAGHGDHGAQSSHEHGSTPADSSSCNCVGACHNGAAALVSIAARPTAILAAVGWDTSSSSPNSDTPVQPRLRRHPPATAPPLA